MFKDCHILLYGNYPFPGLTKLQFFDLIKEGDGHPYQKLDDIWPNILGLNIVKSEREKNKYTVVNNENKSNISEHNSNSANKPLVYIIISLF